jgi:hypothetical protein
VLSLRRFLALSCVLSFVWGLSEATWFFVIPDVWLSFVALEGFVAAAASTCCAVLGALGGVLLLYAFGAGYPQNALRLPELWSRLPGFYPAMVAEARHHLEDGCSLALEHGLKAGIPFRVYVWLCEQLGFKMTQVLEDASWIRLERMMLGPLIVWGGYSVARFACAALDLQGLPLKRVLTAIIAVFWLVVYGYYWGMFLPHSFG